MSVCAPPIPVSLDFGRAVTTEYAAVPASVREARESVVDTALLNGAGSDVADDIRLAVSEAATNVVRHAYRDGTVGCFRVATVLDEDDLLVTIQDDGCGLGGASIHPGMGVGLGLMEQVADQARFRSAPTGGASVQLRFSLA